MRNRFWKIAAGCVAAVAGMASAAYPQAAAPAAPTGSVVVASPTYTSIQMEITINRPATEVWKRIGKYCDVSEWLQIPAGCKITSGTDGEFGAVRTDRCRQSQTCPKITTTVTDTEYWQAFMALNTTDAAGERDLPIPSEVRLYLFAGTQHGGGDQLRQPPFVQPKPPLACQLPVNSNSFFPAKRALLVALRDWVVSGKEPPASTYPTIARKSLVPLAQIKLPYVPATEFSPAGVAAQRFHLDRGPEFREIDITGVMAEPPRIGAPYPVLLPQVDADGNPIDGLRNTAVEVPLGTYTGWNVRKAGFSEGNSCDLIGAFISFFRTKAERVAAGDPRPSLEERYPTHEAYVEKVRAAAKKLVSDRFLLPLDADLIVSQAEAASIP